MHNPEHQSAGWSARLLSVARSPWAVLSMISILTFLVYSRTFFFGFVWDDHPQIVSNPLLRSWKMIPGAFLHHAGFEFNAPIRYYRPLYAMWSFLLFSLFHFNTIGWHLANVLLHVAVTVAVYYLARALKQSHWVAALAALLFGIHPVHIEVVSWLSAVEDALATLLSVAAFLAFMKAADTQGSKVLRWKLLSCALFLAALWSKEIAIAFPADVLAFCWLTSKGQWRKKFQSSFYQALPFAGITVFYLIQRQWALGHVAQVPVDYSIEQLLLTLPSVLLRYLSLLVWPAGLNPLYEIPYISALSFARVLLPLGVLAIVFIVVRWWSKRTNDPIIALLGLWMLLNLVPVLYLPAFNAGEFVRDRYVYLSSVGFVILVAKAFCSLLDARRHWVFVLAPAMVLVVVALTIANVGQQMQWSNDLALFGRAYRLNPENDHAELDYALVLMNWGDYQRARTFLEDVLTRHPDAAALHINLAVVYGNEGNKLHAADELRETLDIDPNYADNPVTKLELARAYDALSDYQKSLALLDDIWQQYPDYFRVAVEMGRAYNKSGNPAEAERWLRHDLSIEPHDAEAHCQLALALSQQHRIAEAAEESRAADAIYPSLKCATASVE